MGAGIPNANAEASVVPRARGGVPLPAPPRKPLARPRAIQQNSASMRREHEVQRLIRDLGALAASHSPQTP
ncbi:hypothetical protein J2S98_004046 [Arthrobacter oryzae]|nr:hypothetical protein [Arthrobacter oryzae]